MLTRDNASAAAGPLYVCEAAVARQTTQLLVPLAMVYGRAATVVLDTSAVLAALPLIQQLYEKAPPYNTDLLLPTTTLKELDRIKDREKFSAAGIGAREAINWINRTLTAEDVDAPTLRAQRQAETLVPGLKADDAILDCCMYNAQHMRNLTILMSDDHNLRSRALAERLETLETRGMSAGQILEAIRERTVGFMDLDASFEADVPDARQEYRVGPADTANVTAQHAMRAAAPQHSQGIDDDDMMDEDHMPAQFGNVENAGLESSRWGANGDAAHQRAPKASKSSSAQRDNTSQRLSIRPKYLQDREKMLQANIAALIDYHLRRENDPEDLELLGYKGPPLTERDAYKVIKAFYVPVFRYLVKRATFDRAEAALRSGPHSAEFRAAWSQMLVELAQKDPEYAQLAVSLHD